MNFQNQIEYGNYYGIDILEGVPDIQTLDRDTLKSHIMFRCGLLTPLYSEPETMQAAITHWFSYMRYDIDKMIALSATEYLPLENFRRNETETVTKNKNGTDVTQHTGTISDSGGETTEDSGTITDEYGSEKERLVSAYNDDDYSPSEKEIVSNGENTRTLDTTREVTNGNTRTFLNTDSITRGETGGETRTRLEFGNIGTMTAQDMFNQELDLLDRFNQYDWIVTRFEKDLFLGIW